MSKEFKPDWVAPPSFTIEDALIERNWTAFTLANKSGLTVLTCYMLIRGDMNITAAIAKGLAKAFDTTSEFWMNRQREYEEGPSSATEPMVSHLCPVFGPEPKGG